MDKLYRELERQLAIEPENLNIYTRLFNLRQRSGMQSLPIQNSWAVNCWASHPSEENDDCLTGVTFSTEEDARAVFNDTAMLRDYHPDAFFEFEECRWVTLEVSDPNRGGDGYYDDIHNIYATVVDAKENPNFQEIVDNDDAWQSEFRHQTMMEFGIDPYGAD